MIINFKYVKKERECHLKTYKKFDNINIQNDRFEIPMGHILSLHTNLAEVINVWLDNGIGSPLVLEEITFLLCKIGELAVLLDIDLIREIEEIQTDPIEVTVNKLFYRITTLESKKKAINRGTIINYIIPMFVELVYSLGFSLEELEEYYKRGMEV